MEELLKTACATNIFFLRIGLPSFSYSSEGKGEVFRVRDIFKCLAERSLGAVDIFSCTHH